MTQASTNGASAREAPGSPPELLVLRAVADPRKDGCGDGIHFSRYLDIAVCSWNRPVEAAASVQYTIRIRCCLSLKLDSRCGVCQTLFVAIWPGGIERSIESDGALARGASRRLSTSLRTAPCKPCFTNHLSQGRRAASGSILSPVVLAWSCAAGIRGLWPLRDESWCLDEAGRSVPGAVYVWN